MKYPQINWTGKSGEEYSYIIFPKGTEFKEIGGNYIFAKEAGSMWDALYIGEGNLKIRTQDSEHLACAELNGFTHYHVHVNENENERKSEEEDMIQGNIECLFENGGCNKTSNG
jgi:hypothetical protein